MEMVIACPLYLWVSVSFSLIVLGIFLGRRSTLAKYDAAVRSAWGIIRGASLGDWSKQPREWRTVAHRWQKDFWLPLSDDLYDFGWRARAIEWWRSRRAIEGNRFTAKIGSLETVQQARARKATERKAAQ